MSDDPQADMVVRWIVPAPDAELSAMELWDRGATAVALDDGPDRLVTLIASYPTGSAAVQVAAAIGAQSEPVDPSWRDAWKAHAEPVAVGSDLMIVPAWRSVPVIKDRLALEIDSGPCFGSGTHASTRLILQLLAERPPADALVIDVGTGSGILAVAAARLGAATVVAVDIDPAAVVVTEANAERNGVRNRIQVSTTPIEALDAAADLALFNVTAGVHAELGAAVVSRVKPGGFYLSGLLPGQWRHVAPTYHDCEVVARPEVDGWAGAVLRRITAA